MIFELLTSAVHTHSSTMVVVVGASTLSSICCGFLPGHTHEVPKWDNLSTELDDELE